MQELELCEQNVAKIFNECKADGSVPEKDVLKTSFLSFSTPKIPVMRFNKKKIMDYHDQINYMFGQLYYVHRYNKQNLEFKLSTGCMNYKGEIWTKDKNMLYTFYYLVTAWHGPLKKFGTDGKTSLYDTRHVDVTVLPDDPYFKEVYEQYNNKKNVRRYFALKNFEDKAKYVYELKKPYTEAAIYGEIIKDYCLAIGMDENTADFMKDHEINSFFYMENRLNSETFNNKIEFNERYSFIDEALLGSSILSYVQNTLEVILYNNSDPLTLSITPVGTHFACLDFIPAFEKFLDMTLYATENEWQTYLLKDFGRWSSEIEAHPYPFHSFDANRFSLNWMIEEKSIDGLSWHNQRRYVLNSENKKILATFLSKVRQMNNDVLSLTKGLILFHNQILDNDLVKNTIDIISKDANQEGKSIANYAVLESYTCISGYPAMLALVQGKDISKLRFDINYYFPLIKVILEEIAPGSPYLESIESKVDWYQQDLFKKLELMRKN